MAPDFEDLYDIEDMDDAELQELILQELDEFPELDPDLLDVSVENGRVTIEGRVGTEQEAQQVEQLVTDVLGIGHFTNAMVVDELVRGQYSEEPEEAAVEDEEVDDQLGEHEGEEAQATESSDHLEEDLAGDAYGTHDVQDAIEKGQSYEPPDRPLQMGVRSRENH